MDFKKILGKKTLVVAGSALATAATTGLVYFLSKNAKMEVVNEVINEDNQEGNVVEVNFEEEKNHEESQKPKEVEIKENIQEVEEAEKAEQDKTDNE